MNTPCIVIERNRIYRVETKNEIKTDEREQTCREIPQRLTCAEKICSNRMEQFQHFGHEMKMKTEVSQLKQVVSVLLMPHISVAQVRTCLLCNGSSGVYLVCPKWTYISICSDLS